MPCYDFKCDDCRIQFEEFCRKITDRESVVCPKCSKPVSQMFLTAPCILGVTDSKKDNFEWFARHNFEKAQNESRTAQATAKAKGLDQYRNIDDITSGENFDPGNW